MNTQQGMKFSLGDLKDDLVAFFLNLIRGIRGEKPNPEQRMNAFDAKRIMEKYIPTFQKETNDITEQLINGTISSEQWYQAIKKELLNLYLTSASAGAGNVRNLEPDTMKEISKKLREQDKYLRKFKDQLDRQLRENQKLEKDKILRRLMLYSPTATEIVERSANRNIGRPSLPFYPKQKTICKNNCKCNWRWVDIDAQKGDWDVFWDLTDEAEHCETCLRRAEKCNPIKIRDFKIISKLDKNYLTVR